MDIGFSEKQELLRNTTRKFLDNECDTKFVRRTVGHHASKPQPGVECEIDHVAISGQSPGHTGKQEHAVARARPAVRWAVNLLINHTINAVITLVAQRRAVACGGRSERVTQSSTP